MMQTPISFILDLILDYELPPDAQKRCRKYIRELESSLSPSGKTTTVVPNRIIHGAQQQPSTQKLLDEMAAQTGAPVIPIAAAPIVNRIVGGEVNTGNGTRGPKKW